MLLSALGFNYYKPSKKSFPCYSHILQDQILAGRINHFTTLILHLTWYNLLEALLPSQPVVSLQAEYATQLSCLLWAQFCTQRSTSSWKHSPRPFFSSYSCSFYLSTFWVITVKHNWWKCQCFSFEMPPLCSVMKDIRVVMMGSSPELWGKAHRMRYDLCEMKERRWKTRNCLSLFFFFFHSLRSIEE